MEQGSPGKKGKQTPAKKGAPAPSPPVESPVTPSLSAEEREKKEQLIKAWREHKTAVKNQGLTSHTHIHTHTHRLIHSISCGPMQSHQSNKG